MICETCKATIPDTAKFCPRCGAKVEIVKKCPSCGAEYPVTAKFCKKDGTPLKEGIKPSVSVERKINPEVAARPKIEVAPKVEVKKEEAKRPSKAWIWIAVCELVLIIAGVGSYLYFSGQISKKPVAVTTVPKVSGPREPMSKPKEVQRKVNMDDNFKKKLNTFFSNFSEAGVDPFARGKIDNKALIRFGVLHNYINRFDRFESVGNEIRLKDIYVERAVERYFGRKLNRHESVPSFEYEGGGSSLPITYKDGYYYTVGADGEAQTFSQVAELFDIGNDEFMAIVHVYTASNAWEGDPHGTPEQWRREDPYDVPKRTGRMIATIRKVYSDTRERYVLLEYLKAQ
ncbi:MAG: zinc-ribbon domain-containing protein [Candidatus Aminicenantia bacterium]